MNISVFRTFLAVGRKGDLNKAAAQLNVTESTVPAQPDALEDTLGKDLLIQSRRGSQLTKAGFAFQNHADLMFLAWDQARKAVGLLNGFLGLFSIS